MELSDRHHAGFSLLELLITMAITAIAVLAAVGLMTKFARTAGAFTEVSTMEEARGSAETALRADLDGAGRNLTRPTPPLAGTIFATPNSFDNYNWSNGTITKITGTGWDNGANITHALATGLGSYTFTPPANGGSAYIYSPNGDTFAIVIGFGNPAIGVWMGVYVNGVEVAATCCHPPNETIGAHVGGDSYTFKIENGTSQRIAKLYRVRNNVPTPLWTSNVPVTSYPIGFGLNVYYQNQSFTNVKITGAPLIALSGNATEFAPLPYDLNTQLTAPLTTTGGGSGIIALSGDPTTDAVTTTDTFKDGASDITAHAPQRGSFNEGDYVLIIDWGSLDPSAPGGAASALCSVSSVSIDSDPSVLDGSPLVKLTVERVRKDNPAWSRLWSTDSDHSHTFGPGSTLTKLQAPVSYTTSKDSRLVRMEGDHTSTIAFNVRRANFNRYVEFNSTALIFQVDITLAAEGVETDNTSSTETRGTIEFRSRPRALNLASNRLN
jgi:prepilin-type N-terminal cleavage/methylation domain-containing protein